MNDLDVVQKVAVASAKLSELMLEQRNTLSDINQILQTYLKEQEKIIEEAKKNEHS